MNDLCMCFIFFTFRNDGQEFGGSIYQKCSDKLDVGVQLSWTSGSNNTKIGLGDKWQLDKDAAVLK